MLIYFYVVPENRCIRLAIFNWWKYIMSVFWERRIIHSTKHLPYLTSSFLNLKCASPSLYYQVLWKHQWKPPVSKFMSHSEYSELMRPPYWKSLRLSRIKVMKQIIWAASAEKQNKHVFHRVTKLNIYCPPHFKLSSNLLLSLTASTDAQHN